MMNVLDGNRPMRDQLPSTWRIGAWSYGAVTIVDWGEGSVLEVGAYTSMAFGSVIFLGGEHNTHWVTTFPFSEMWPDIRARLTQAQLTGHPKTNGDVVIGSDVWIGAGVTILSGVHIGHGAVIGSGAVIAKNVPPYTIAVGNPVQHVGRRFCGETVGALLRLCWWDWPEAKVKRAVPDMLGGGVENFIRKAEQGAYDQL